LPQFLAEVGHGLKALGLFLPEPFIYLPGPEILLSPVRKPGLQLSQAQVADICKYCVSHSAKIAMKGSLKFRV
jgi:hypothetical protein